MAGTRVPGALGPQGAAGNLCGEAACVPLRLIYVLGGCFSSPCRAAGRQGGWREPEPPPLQLGAGTEPPAGAAPPVHPVRAGRAAPCSASCAWLPCQAVTGRARPEQSQPFVRPIKLSLAGPASGLLAPRSEQPAALRRSCTCWLGLSYRKAERMKETFQADGVQRSNGLTLITIRGGKAVPAAGAVRPGAPRCPERARVFAGAARARRTSAAVVPAGPSQRAAALSACQGRPGSRIVPLPPGGELTWTCSLACEFVFRPFPPCRVFRLIPECQRCALGYRRAGSCLALRLPSPSGERPVHHAPAPPRSRCWCKTAPGSQGRAGGTN